MIRAAGCGLLSRKQHCIAPNSFKRFQQDNLINWNNIRPSSNRSFNFNLHNPLANKQGFFGANIVNRTTYLSSCSKINSNAIQNRLFWSKLTNWAHTKLTEHKTNELQSADKEKKRKRTWEETTKEWKAWTTDKIVAITSWFVIGTTLYIVIGTTTVISLLLWFANQLDKEDYVAQYVGEYLTRSTGINITYDEAVGTSIWKEGPKIRMKGVKLYRPPPNEKENHSLIDLNIDEVDVKLSLWWMLAEGRGLVKELEARKVTGIVDRRTEKYDPEWKPTRRSYQRGDFEIEKVTVEDVLITLYLPDPEGRPLSLSMFNAEFEPLRKHWLLYDIFCARSMLGIFDGCLFKYGTPISKEVRESTTIWKERSLKLDGLKMDMFCKNAEGLLGWLHDGTLDINLRLLLPNIYEDKSSFFSSLFPPSVQPRKIHMFWNLQFNHINLQPIYTPQLSYFNNAVVQVVARYMNAHTKHIPLSFEMHIPEDHFDGAWTPAQANLWNVLGEAVYDALAIAIDEQKKNTTWKEFLRYLWKFFFG